MRDGAGVADAVCADRAEGARLLARLVAPFPSAVEATVDLAPEEIAVLALMAISGRIDLTSARNSVASALLVASWKWRYSRWPGSAESYPHGSAMSANALNPSRQLSQWQTS
jgi:hypothetical protein